MEEFKLDNYRSYLPKGDSGRICYIGLSPEEAISVCSHVLKISGYKDRGDFGPAAYRHITEGVGSSFQQEGNLDSEALRKILDGEELVELSVFACIWDLSGHVDLMSRSELLDKWEDIWYPPSDEVLILWSVYGRKIIVITDYGLINVINYVL